MADEKILLEIEFNNSEVKDAVKNISAGRKAIDELVEANKKLAAQGQKNSVEYVKNVESIKALNVEVNQNSKIVQANTQANKANADSIDKVVAENKLLVAERKKLDTTTADGAKRLTEINAHLDKNNTFLDANISKTEKQNKNFGQFSGILSTVSPQLGGFAGNLGAAQGETGGLTDGLGKMTKAALGFVLTPLGLVITAIVLGLKLLSTWLTNSTAGMDFLEDAASVVSATIQVLTDNMGKLIGAMIKLGTFNFGGAIADFKSLGDEIAREVSLTLELNSAIRELEDAEINYEIATSKSSNTVKELLLQSKNRTLSERERIKLLAQADKIEADRVQELIKNRQEALRIANEEANKKVELSRLAGEAEDEFGQRLLDTGLLLDEQRDKVKEAIIAFNNALGDGIGIREKIQNQTDALAEKAEAAAEKRAEAERKRLEDIAKKQEEIRQRTISAENELEIARLKVEARQIEGLENQTDKLIEIEQVRLRQQLENTELVEAERQKLIFESEEAIDEILLQSRERESMEEQAALQQSLEDFQAYTQGLINAEKEKYLQGIISKEEYDQQITDLELATLETQALIKQQYGEEDLALQGRITDYKIALGEKEVQIKRQQEQAKVDAVKNGLGTIASAFNKQSVAFKVLASVQTLITTYQSAIAAFNSLANIPYIGTILGIAAAAAATANGLAAVAKINSVQTPKMEEGGAMEITGRRHSQGGEDVSIGGKRVANVERGEKMVILKRGANLGLMKNLSTINALAGGKDFFTDRAPAYHNLDGGFIARSAAQQSRQITGDTQTTIVKPILQLSELHRVEDNVSRAEVTSELR